MNNKYSRNCPLCDKEMLYNRKKDRNYAENKKAICRDCATKERAKHGNFNPKEQFTCSNEGCGNTFFRWKSQMLNPNVPFCSRKCWTDHQARTKSLVGKRFGRLMAIDRKRTGKTTFYACQCDCGNTSTVSHSDLMSGSTKSCGCLQKDIVAERSKKPVEQSITGEVYNYYKRNANDRNIEWELTREDVQELIFKPCFYCGTDGGTTTTTHTKYERSRTNNGIDRFDNTIGYTKENSVSCCKDCNYAKHDLCFDAFKEWALKLVERLQTLNISNQGGRKLGEAQTKRKK